MNEIHHDKLAVVYATKEYALVSKRNTCVSKLSKSFLCIRSHFLRMVEMRVQPNRMIFLEHIHKVIRNSLRHNYRSSRAETDNLYVLNLSEFADDVLKSFILNKQSITAGEKYVSNLRSVSDVFDTSVDIFLGSCTVCLARKSSSCAVTAVHGALVRDKEENSIRISVRKARCRRVCILVERIRVIGFRSMHFQKSRNSLHSYRVSLVIRIHE